MWKVDGYFILPQRRAITQNWKIISRNRKFAVSVSRGDFDRGSEVKYVSNSQRDRRSGKIIDVESSVGSLNEVFTKFLSKAVNMIPVIAVNGRAETLMDLEEIGEIISISVNKGVISDRSRSLIIKEEKAEKRKN